MFSDRSELQIGLCASAYVGGVHHAAAIARSWYGVSEVVCVPR